MGRHSGKSGGAASSGRAPRQQSRAVRWLSQPGSGEALAGWGTVFICFGGVLSIATAWGYLVSVVGALIGAVGVQELIDG